MITLETILTIGAYVISFSMTYFLLFQWIKYAKKVNVLGRDMHKVGNVMIPEAGGIVVLSTITFSLFYYGAIQVLKFHSQNSLTIILGTVGSIACVAIIGAVDDFRGWKIGLQQWQKPLLTIPAAIPFLLVNINRTTIDIPLMSGVDVGLIYPLLLIPIAIVGASNAFNMLAGYNGLEAGMGLIILGVFAFLSHLNGQTLAVSFCLIGFFALLAFLMHNWYPAKIFPGDTLTYPIGSFIAICAILGRIEKFGLVLFIPYFLDFILPLRMKMNVEAFAKVNSDGSFDPPYETSYDSTHLVIFILKRFKKKVYEKDVVLTILGFEAFLGFLCIMIALLK